jgi:hypothetical protein
LNKRSQSNKNIRSKNSRSDEPVPKPLTVAKLMLWLATATRLRVMINTSDKNSAGTQWGYISRIGGREFPKRRTDPFYIPNNYHDC